MTTSVTVSAKLRTSAGKLRCERQRKLLAAMRDFSEDGESDSADEDSSSAASSTVDGRTKNGNGMMPERRLGLKLGRQRRRRQKPLDPGATQTQVKTSRTTQVRTHQKKSPSSALSMARTTVARRRSDKLEIVNFDVAKFASVFR